MPDRKVLNGHAEPPDMGLQLPFLSGGGERSLPFDQKTLHQLGGLTGLGWTTSVLGYASTVAGYGTGYVSRLVADPQSFLYAGGVLFLATLGLDTLSKRLDE